MGNAWRAPETRATPSLADTFEKEVPPPSSTPVARNAPVLPEAATQTVQASPQVTRSPDTLGLRVKEAVPAQSLR
jgi:hypothetical protein